MLTSKVKDGSQDSFPEQWFDFFLEKKEVASLFDRRRIIILMFLLELAKRSFAGSPDFMGSPSGRINIGSHI